MVGSDQNFTFDYVYGVSQRQEEVMEECVVPLVDGIQCSSRDQMSHSPNVVWSISALFEGFNATILAYGQVSATYELCQRESSLT